MKQERAGNSKSEQALLATDFTEVLHRCLGREFVNKAVDGARSGVLHGRKHGQNGSPMAVAEIAPASAEDALAILRQDREATNSACSG
jgi:hypothetical protein